MNSKCKLMVAIALPVCTLLQACGGGSHYSSGNMSSSSSSSSSAITLDASQVLVSAQVTSETDEPIAVNDGMVTVTGSSDETSDPVVVAP